MMTDDQIDLAIFRAVARGLSTPMRHSVARSMGILPPRNVSIDAGKPMPRDGSDWRKALAELHLQQPSL